MLKTLELPVKLTDEEVRLKGEAIARKLKDKEVLEERRKEIAKELKEEIAELDAEIVKARDEVRERREMRDVEVHDIKDWDRKIVRTIRIDTGDVVASRPMKPAELQQHLSIVGADGEEYPVTFESGRGDPEEDDELDEDDEDEEPEDDESEAAAS